MGAPNTISDKEWRRIQSGAQRSAPPLFSKESRQKIAADNARRGNAKKN